jgi:tape measure domain-containing protein
MTPTLEATLRLDIAQYEAQLAKAKGEANKLKSDLAKAQGGFGRGLLGGLGAAGLTAGMVAISREAVGVVIGMDRMRRAMTSMEGSAEGAQARLAELREAAKLPGVGFEQAVQADIRLRSVKISADMSRRAIVEFGNELALSGGTAADLDGVVLALGQIAAKASVSAEEINQIAERVPRIRQIMKDAFGTADTTAIQKMGLSTDAFISGLVTTMEKGKRAVAGLDERISDMEESVKTVLLNLFEPLVQEGIPALNELAAAVAENKDAFAALGSTAVDVFGKIGSMAKFAGQTIGGAAFAMGGNSDKFQKDMNIVDPGLLEKARSRGLGVIADQVEANKVGNRADGGGQSSRLIHPRSQKSRNIPRRCRFSSSRRRPG